MLSVANKTSKLKARSKNVSFDRERLELLSMRRGKIIKQPEAVKPIIPSSLAIKDPNFIFKLKTQIKLPNVPSKLKKEQIIDTLENVRYCIYSQQIHLNGC